MDEDMQHAEAIAGDYHPRAPRHADTDNSDHARLARAAATLQEGHADAGFSAGACARLLAVISEARRRDVAIDEDVLATAMAISAHVLELGPRD